MPETREQISQRLIHILPAIGSNDKTPEELKKLCEELKKQGCFNGIPELSDDFYKTLLDEMKNGAIHIGIFGSRAKGKAKPGSDLDMIVINPKTNNNTPGLEESGIGGKVHIVTRNGVIMTVRLIDIQRFKNENPSVFDTARREIIQGPVVWVWQKTPTPPNKAIKRR